MLNGAFDKLVYKIRRKTRPKVVRIAGIRVSADLEDVPEKIRRQLYRSDYEKGELTQVRRALRADDRVLEVGAGIGFISLVCARICGPENVLSYEPNPAMKRVIEKNYSLNGLRPTLRNKVLATEAGTVDFYFSDNVLSSSLIDRDHGGRTPVEADAIGEVVAAYGPSAIVMDVEGAETGLLRACDLSGIRTIVIEMHPHIVGAAAIDALADFLENEGLRLQDRDGKRYLFQRPVREN